MAEICYTIILIRSARTISGALFVVNVGYCFDYGVLNMMFIDQKER